MTDFKVGDLYEDKRTHRSGRILEYNEKFKTFLLESSDGKTFNVTSSQFKINWRLIEQNEVQEVIEPVAESVEVKAKSTYKGTTEEEKKELHGLFTNSTLYINDYVKSFENSAVTMKVAKPESKHTIRLRVDATIIVDIQIMVGKRRCRLWIDEYDFNKASWSIEPLAQKKYPYDNRSYTVEFNLEDLPQILEDFRAVILDRLVEIKGGIEEYEI